MENRIILKWLTLTILSCVISAFIGANNYVKDTVQAKSIPPTSNSGTPPTMQSGITGATKVASPPLSPIELEIKTVFGKYYPQAMKLLKGKACHENLKLDTNAVNDNRTWGGIGKDRGIFQINDIYHPTVSDACAFDYKCNIKYAYQMFVNDHHTFKRWTCGKYYGI